MQKIETILTPALFPFRTMNDTHICVVNDILRATTSICTAISNGAKAIIPVRTIEQAKEYKDKGYLVAGERIEKTFPFADWGNSALEFTKERVCGNEIVHSTTNGTVAISIASEGNPQEIVIGAFCNLSCLSDYLVAKGKDVQIFCSGWKNTPALEDTVFAGALAEKLLQSGKFENKNDSTNLALALWREAKSDLRAYMEKASHIHRLRKYHMDDVFDYTFQIDTCNVVPKLEQNKIVGVVQ
ncbi:MAG: 2-phosphosulfolactate phosphatase [Candidatus Onthomorpha sp.]|nr:2-phosphosulfolactate phosphatase [Bacteroidales bacterium]MDY4584804.1 2-phosphosulfolactate phosphatase [Candidatus Onthomorpha sp.]MCI7035435.1 2-phosphosulfolactate phosphatase [Bacteroidales bacterium]MDD6613107.1 2-phosphosulfolactate phosphatase [Bacteroidales bacterium]MDY4860962.1 2-phosphosulfolactate phosphatase [Candidatus Onthomorpha sp.]